MEKESWGIKRVCLSCNARFYDFGKSPIVCPACGTAFDPEYIYKRKAKNSQEKIDDADPIGVDLADDILTDDEDIVSIDDDEEDLIEQEK